MAQTLGELRDITKVSNSTYQTFKDSMDINKYTNEALRKIVQDNRVTKEVFKRQNEIQELSNSLNIKPFQNESFTKLVKNSSVHASLYNQIKPTFNNLYSGIKLSESIIPPRNLGINNFLNLDFRIMTQVNQIYKNIELSPNIKNIISSIKTPSLIATVKEQLSFDNEEIDSAFDQLYAYAENLKTENYDLKSELEEKKKHIEELELNQNLNKKVIEEMLERVFNVYNIISSTLLKTATKNIGNEIYIHGITHVALDNWLFLMICTISCIVSCIFVSKKDDNKL